MLFRLTAESNRGELTPIGPLWESEADAQAALELVKEHIGDRSPIVQPVEETSDEQPEPR